MESKNRVRKHINMRSRWNSMSPRPRFNGLSKFKIHVHKRFDIVAAFDGYWVCNVGHYMSHNVYSLLRPQKATSRCPKSKRRYGPADPNERNAKANRRTTEPCIGWAKQKACHWAHQRKSSSQGPWRSGVSRWDLWNLHQRTPRPWRRRHASHGPTSVQPLLSPRVHNPMGKTTHRQTSKTRLSTL